MKKLLLLFIHLDAHNFKIYHRSAPPTRGVIGKLHSNKMPYNMSRLYDNELTRRECGGTDGRTLCVREKLGHRDAAASKLRL